MLFVVVDVVAGVTVVAALAVLAPWYPAFAAVILKWCCLYDF